MKIVRLISRRIVNAENGSAAFPEPPAALCAPLCPAIGSTVLSEVAMHRFPYAKIFICDHSECGTGDHGVSALRFAGQTLQVTLRLGIMTCQSYLSLVRPSG